MSVISKNRRKLKFSFAKLQSAFVLFVISHSQTNDTNKNMSEQAFDLVRRSVARNTITDDGSLLESLRITRTKELSSMEFLFRIFGKPCFPRGELVAVTGKAKSGKTLFNSMLMACCVRDEVLQIQRPFDEVNGAWQSVPVRCLWYDTEQSEKSTQEILKDRLTRLIEAPGQMSCSKESWESYFDIFNVRQLHYDDRLHLFEAAVKKYQPALVVLDGVRDLMADINDGVNAQAIVEKLMRLAQDTNCCIVCVLHQNKGNEDRNPRGWIGTELMNKAFEVYSCEKLKPENIFVVEQTHTRKYDLGELLFFKMDANTELPVVCGAPTRFVAMNGCIPGTQPSGKLPLMNLDYLTFDENNKPHPKSQELFYEALKTGPLYYSDLQARVQSLLNCGTQMWNNMFSEMRDKGAIIRSKNKEGKYVWQLPVVQEDMFSGLDGGPGDSPSS